MRGRWQFLFLVLVTAAFAGGFTVVATGDIVENRQTNVRQDRTDRILSRAVRDIAAVQVQVADTAKRTDREIAMSRVNSVRQTCLQFNDVQGVLSSLVRGSLAVQDERASKTRAAFEAALRLLAPNDCAAQQRKLERALDRGDFSASVPYSPTP